MIEKGIPRPELEILVKDKVVGFITSGTISPSLNKGVGIAYINKKHTYVGTELMVNSRNKLKKARVVTAPFYSSGTLNN